MPTAPVKVSVEVPGGVLPMLVLTVAAADAGLEPFGVTKVGDTEQAAPAGTPEQLSATAWLNPPIGPTLSV